MAFINHLWLIGLVIYTISNSKASNTNSSIQSLLEKLRPKERSEVGLGGNGRQGSRGHVPLNAKITSDRVIKKVLKNQQQKTNAISGINEILKHPAYPATNKILSFDFNGSNNMDIINSNTDKMTPNSILEEILRSFDNYLTNYDSEKHLINYLLTNNFNDNRSNVYTSNVHSINKNGTQNLTCEGKVPPSLIAPMIQQLFTKFFNKTCEKNCNDCGSPTTNAPESNTNKEKKMSTTSLPRTTTCSVNSCKAQHGMRNNERVYPGKHDSIKFHSLQLPMEPEDSKLMGENVGTNDIQAAVNGKGNAVNSRNVVKLSELVKNDAFLRSLFNDTLLDLSLKMFYILNDSDKALQDNFGNFTKLSPDYK